MLHIPTLTFNGLFAVESCIGNLPEGLTGIHIGNMHLNSRNGNRLQGIQNRHGGMGVGGGIDDDAVIHTISGLNCIHNCTFVVGLEMVDLNTGIDCGLRNQRQQVSIAVFAVNARLPDAQHIDIGSVDHQKLHFKPSHSLRISPVACSGVPLLSI